MDIIKLLQICHKNISDVKDLLNDLDQQIGDGDHGTNMDRGFTALLDKKDSFEGKDISQILNESTMVLISQVAGSSGPLFGTALMKAGAYLKGKENPTQEDYVNAFRQGVEGIKMRGKSTVGEKTMLDVLDPAVEYLEQNITKDVKDLMGEVVELAKKHAEETANIVATKGRAAYLGERSIGHRDPGAYSSMILLTSFKEFLEG